MGRHDDLLTDLVEGQTYQIHTSPDGRGGIRWFLMRYQVPPPEVSFGRAEPVWLQIATCTTCRLAADYHRGFALNWLRELGHEPDAMDVRLFLMPHVIERLRPAAKDPS